MAPVGPKGAPSTQRLRREQTQVKVASLLAPPLFPSPVPSVDLCGLWLLPSLLGRSRASMAGSRRSPREHPARPARSHERPPTTQPPNDVALPRFHETLPACAPRLRLRVPSSSPTATVASQLRVWIWRISCLLVDLWDSRYPANPTTLLLASVSLN